jgi:hypothetical protein
LAGCELLCQNVPAPESQAGLDLLRKRTVIVNLAQVPDFDTAFMESLYLRPLEVNQP